MNDLKFAFRQLLKQPGFTVVAVLTLALGIVANTTIVSWISATILDPVPGAVRTGDLVSVNRGERSEHPTPPFSYPDYADLRERSQTFSGLLAYHDDFVSLTGAGKPERVYGALISANYFEVLGVRPVLGSAFLAAEEEKPGRTPSVIISHGLWQRRFGADRSIIGKPIQVNRQPCTVVAVAPPEFRGCHSGLRTDLWAPLAYRGSQIQERGSLWLNVVGRLKPGIDRRQAEAELDTHMRHVAEQFPDSHRQPNQITLDPLWRSPFGANVYFYKSLPGLLALAALLLLLACANVATLLLVHSVARRREIAIRLSLGATRLRLIRQILTESLLLALAGGALALLLTFWTAGALAAFIPTSSLPLALSVRVDGPVFLAAFILSMVSAVVFGTAPALRSSKLAPLGILKEEAGSISAGLHKSRLASTLVVAQVSLSLVLMVAAGLIVRSLQNAQRLDPGFDPDHVLLATFELEPAGYSRAQGVAFDRQLLSALTSLPGVESVTLADFSPLSFTIHTDIVQPDGYVPQPGESMEISRARVGPDYFRTLGTALRTGRDFSAQDVEDSQPVAIVNQAFAERYWPGKDPLGKRITNRGRSLTVIGVACNSKYRRLVYPPEPVIFLPLFQDYDDEVVIHARVAGDPRAFAATVEKTLHRLNPELPLYGVTTLRSSMRLGSLFERLAGASAGAFGLLALLIAAVGIYGVVDYTTRQRTREFGVRMALGAKPGALYRLVLGHGLRLASIGLGAGLALSLLLVRFLQSLLFGVSELEVPTIAVVSLGLCAVALVACFVPTRRATKIDPTVALRYE
jgi:predicted permease